ncbi:Zinc finger CCCH domain-containing protein 1 [Striga hermonthica]|uniref:Zinc finger CCCH domain-containing protein 1 n=1 Tax=Striga hermonthica TaxID=68872 RepID=A0A9N7N2S3_STRHE|nr:Zinc finger CCCH domain-containing protein 1 [Striga hermonthica]
MDWPDKFLLTNQLVEAVAVPPCWKKLRLVYADSFLPLPNYVCNLFRKPAKGKNIRKRTSTEEGDGEREEEESTIVINKKKQVASDNKLRFSSGSAKTSKESEVDKPKATVFKYQSSREIQVHNDNRATATLETETEFSRDAHAIRERVLKQAEEALKGKNKADGSEKIYKGMHGYTDYKAGFRREHTVASEKASGAMGPLGPRPT